LWWKREEGPKAEERGPSFREKERRSVFCSGARGVIARESNHTVEGVMVVVVERTPLLKGGLLLWAFERETWKEGDCRRAPART